MSEFYEEQLEMFPTNDDEEEDWLDVSSGSCNLDGEECEACQ